MSTSAGFTVPVARDRNGRLVGPDEAAKGRTYECPSCASAVDLHAGARKRRHFHHRAGAACSTESAAHAGAKWLLVDALMRWIVGRSPEGRASPSAPAPAVLRRCANAECETRTTQPFPKKVLRAVPERRLGGGRIVDVGLLGPADVPIAAIEIHQTHAVDSKKSRAVEVPWIEVEALQVCEARGLHLVPVQDRFVPWFCPDHRDDRRAHAKDERAAPLRRNAVVASFGFRLEDFPGFRIVRFVVCPHGHDAAVFAWHGTTPPSPRPPLVVARERALDAYFSGPDRRLYKTLPFRRRYVSICGACGAELEAAR